MEKETAILVTNDDRLLTVQLGVAGEHLARTVGWDISPWVETFGAGEVQLLASRPADTGPYPAVVSREGDLVLWRVRREDLWSGGGYGKAQLVYRVNGAVVVRSRCFRTAALPAIEGGGQGPDDPQQDWVEEMFRSAAQVAENAQKAEGCAASAAESARLAQEAGRQMRQEIEAAALQASSEAVRQSTEQVSASAARAESSRQAADGFAQTAVQKAEAAGESAAAALDSAAAAAQSAEAASGSAVSAAASAQTAQDYSGKPPAIQDGSWHIWDAEAGGYQDTGLPARGETGAAGPGITKVERTGGSGLAGTADTYTVYNAAGTAVGTFQVYQGANGGGAGDFLANGSVPMTADLHAGGHRVVEVGEPVEKQDAVNRAYCDREAGRYGIVAEASGEVVVLRDSANDKLKGLRLFGKSVQEGEPSPETPVPIESAGKSGNLTLKIQRKNLIYEVTVASSNGVTMSSNGDGTFTLNGTVVGSTAGLYFVGRYNSQNIVFPKSTYYYSVDGLNDEDRIIIRDHTNDENMGTGSGFVYSGDIAQVSIRLEVGSSYNNSVIKPMLIVGENAPNEFVPGIQPQTLTYPIPNGLPGIPVEDGGNYTDSDGQQWICDEVDFGRGKYVQRVKSVTYDGSTDENWNDSRTNQEGIYGFYVMIGDVKPFEITEVGHIICNRFTPVRADTVGTFGRNQGVSINNRGDVIFYCNAVNDTVESWKIWLSNNPVTVLYELATPIETDLPSEVLEAYAALATYKPATTILTDGSPSAGIQVAYTADTKAYIDQKFAALAALQAQVDALTRAEG